MMSGDADPARAQAAPKIKEAIESFENDVPMDDSMTA